MIQWYCYKYQGIKTTKQKTCAMSAFKENLHRYRKKSECYPILDYQVKSKALVITVLKVRMSFIQIVKVIYFHNKSTLKDIFVFPKIQIQLAKLSVTAVKTLNCQ